MTANRHTNQDDFWGNWRYSTRLSISSSDDTSPRNSDLSNIDIFPIIWEINGYVREVGHELHPKIIPSGINQIICKFYDPVKSTNFFIFLRDK